MLQRWAVGGQLLNVRVTDGAIGGEEKLSQSWQVAGELLEASGAALQSGTPAQVELLQHPEQPEHARSPSGLTAQISHSHRKCIQFIFICGCTTELKLNIHVHVLSPS